MLSRPFRVRFDGRHDISGIHDALGPIGQFLIVYTGVGGRDDDEVESCDRWSGPRYGFGSCPLRVFACRPDDGHMRIVIGDDGAALLEFFEQSITWRLAFVVNIGLVGKTEDKDSAPFDRFSVTH